MSQFRPMTYNIKSVSRLPSSSFLDRKTDMRAVFFISTSLLLPASILWICYVRTLRPELWPVLAATGGGLENDRGIDPVL